MIVEALTTVQVPTVAVQVPGSASNCWNGTDGPSVTVAVTVAAASLRLALTLVLGEQSPYFPFVLAVLVAAWYVGSQIAGPRMLTVEDFRVAFFLIALLPLLSALGFLRLSPLDGAEVSGHRRTQSRAA